MNPYVENKMNDCRRQLENLKSQISGEKYQYVEKLRILKLEQKKIEARMQENKRKAMNEKDPTKRARFLQLIEENSKLLEENLRQQQAIPKSEINFDPAKHVSEMVEGMLRAIQGKNKDGSGGGGGGEQNKTKKPNSLDNPFGDNSGSGGNNNT